MLPQPIWPTLIRLLGAPAPNKGPVMILGTAKTALAPTAFLRKLRRDVVATETVE